MTGKELYRKYAAGLPLIDWHNHLSIRDLALDRRFENITELWIAPDPYKHRAMRICGVPEEKITLCRDPFELFRTWAEIFPQLAGNPLYAWTLLELERVFGIDPGKLPLNAANAPLLWEKMNASLQEKDLSARGLLKKFQVEYASPCAAFEEELAPFAGIPGIAPSLRGDGIASLAPSALDFLRTCGKLETLEDFKRLVSARLDGFDRAKCSFSDHALDAGFAYERDDGKNDLRFRSVLNGERLSPAERGKLHSEILRILGKEYGKRRWTMQLHIGALRSTNTLLKKQLGPAGGFAGISHPCDTASVAAFLDDLMIDSSLPRTILYTLNPADHAALSVLSGSFAGNGIRGNVTLGPAWWFCDHLYGMRDALEVSAAYGILSVFPGMTTDSRSLLSFVRHEYFRKVLCTWIAEKVSSGDLPADETLLADLIRKICHDNASAMIPQK